MGAGRQEAGRKWREERGGKKEAGSGRREDREEICGKNGSGKTGGGKKVAGRKYF